MGLIKFYKSGNVWTLGNTEGFPAGMCVRHISMEDSRISIRSVNDPGPTGKIIEQGLYSDFCDANGDAYASLAAFKAATDGFFGISIDLTPLTNGTQKTKILDAALDIINPATVEGQAAILTAIGLLSTSAKQDSLKAAVDLLATASKQEDIKTLLGTINTSVNSSGSSQFKTFSVEITRPANTTVYSANDVVADVSAAFIQFANVAKANGAGVKITRVRIQTEDTGVAGKKFNLHLYKEAPTFIADNAAFAVSYANATKRIGAIPVVMGTGNLGTVGMNDYNVMITNPTAKDIYWILETVDGFTPSANSTKFTVVIDCELSN